MNKLYALIAGPATGLISVLFLNEIFKWLIASCFLYPPQLFISGIHLSMNINFSALSFFPILLIVISPLLFSLIMIEISSFILKKLEKEYFRINLMIYMFINIGYLIFNIMLGIFALILRSAYTNDWGRFLQTSGYSYNQKLVLMLFVMVILFAYLNYTTKRMRSFIPVIKKPDEMK